MNLDEVVVLQSVCREIMKNRIVKLSKLEFTEDILYNNTEYSRITDILKKWLIK